MTLRPYQVEAVESALKAFESHRSTLVVMPTGTGKTQVFCEVIRRWPGRALVLAHRNELVLQAANRLRDFGMEAQIEQASQRVSHSQMMFGKEVVVGMVQSLHKARLERFPCNAFDLIVVDEAHHTVAAGYRAILEHFSEAKVLGVTATPDRGDGMGLHNVFRDVCFTLEIEDAIKQGYLCNIQSRMVYCEDLDLSELRTKCGDLSAGDLERAMDTEKILHQIASPLVREAGKRQTIVFCPGVAMAKHLAHVLGAYVDPSKVVAIDGGTESSVRASEIAAYMRGDRQFLVGCDVFSEGFDAPNTSCIAICRPTKSRSVYTQQVGRGFRLAEGKPDLLVLDFVGNNGKHKLVCPTDILGGKNLDEPTQRRMRQLADEGYMLTEAKELAIKEAAEERLRREQEDRERLARTYARSQYSTMLVDPFRYAQAEYARAVERGEPYLATERQIDWLKRNGVELPEKVTRSTASRFIGEIRDGRRRVPCTPKQAKLLERFGFSPNATKSEASEIISSLAQNGWRKTPELSAKFQTISKQF